MNERPLHMDLNELEEGRSFQVNCAQCILYPIPLTSEVSTMSPFKTKLVTCPECKGQGTRRDPKTAHALKCGECGGSGTIEIPEDKND
jgi:DnaJ-class molecular chaperone